MKVISTQPQDKDTKIVWLCRRNVRSITNIVLHVGNIFWGNKFHQRHRCTLDDTKWNDNDLCVLRGSTNVNLSAPFVGKQDVKCFIYESVDTPYDDAL